MESKKKDSEVFNLLNLYQDDDDDDMDDVEKNEEKEEEPQQREEELQDASKVEDLRISDEFVLSSTSLSMETSNVQFTAVSTMKWSSLRPPTPQSSVTDPDVLRQRREKPSIVDYAHDDVAVSPEHEDGEIMAGRVMYGEELEVTHDFSQRTPGVNVMTPNEQVDSPQLSAQINVSHPDHSAMIESEAEIGEGVNLFSETGIDVDPVQNFLPPPPEKKCSDELQVIPYYSESQLFNISALDD